MHFCPNCGTMLLIEADGSQQRLFCSVCPYIYAITKTITRPLPIHAKHKSFMYSGSDEWENASKTETAVCPKCEHTVAHFIQIQIRSADEPATTFYRCDKCSYKWNDNN